ncbi:hypothetical protein [Pseudoalteromonas denitrificans]|uniref:Uncharacterized protein n=1 Tax=Pseudoalteromonas denitrificans DSM 6059 TaxID=1123010 RepID=A0A1I1UXR7_9GAMM|nr:hypothetical protein [Pseudoalteromonas denitrificans]SFD75622.1 hypothetical protein SAMN02745724_05371 [Pseudoalteromonas denitrificans DSM 6059]
MKDDGDFTMTLGHVEQLACETATAHVIQIALIHKTMIAVGEAGKVCLLDAKTLKPNYDSELNKSNLKS